MGVGKDTDMETETEVFRRFRRCFGTGKSRGVLKEGVCGERREETE